MSLYISTINVENEEEDAMLSAYSEYLDRIRVSFDAGDVLPLEDILMPIDIEIEKASLRGKMTDYLMLDDVDVSIISEKAKELFEKKNITNIQTIPTVLIDEYFNADAVEEAKLRDEDLAYKKVVYENYALFNITSLIDCINHETSNLEYYTPRQDIPEDMPEEMKALLDEEEDNDIDFIYKLVLDEDKIPDDISIFRLKDCPRILVFKEEVVKAIRAAELTGFVFVPLSKYTDEIPDDDDEEEKKEADIRAADVKIPPVEKKEVAEKPRKGIRITNIKKKQ